MAADSITGLILAGGLARRMDGQDKGLLPLSGRPLIAHVLERFAPQVDHVLINANRHRDIYATFGYPVIADVITGHVGPLAGLHAGLQACGTPLLAAVPCDAPLLPEDLVARLVDALEHGKAPVAAASTGNRLQPAFLLCRRQVVDDLAHHLAGGGRSLHAWLATLGAVHACFDDGQAFANINTPEDLALLEK